MITRSCCPSGDAERLGVVPPQAGERSGLYNFQQFALIKEGQGYEAAVSAVEEQFVERRMQLDRQFAMRMEVAEAEWGAGVRRAGTALTPKPTPAILDLRHTLHHLSEQKRFAEAAEVQVGLPPTGGAWWLRAPELDGFVYFVFFAQVLRPQYALRLYIIHIHSTIHVHMH